MQRVSLNIQVKFLNFSELTNYLILTLIIIISLMSLYETPVSQGQNYSN